VLGPTTAFSTTAHQARAPRIQHYGYKPREVCPSNRTCFTRVKWSRWGETAVGLGYAKTCSTGGFACHTAWMSITYWRPVALCGGYYYTRWHYKAPGVYLMYGYIEEGTCIPRAEPLQ
jgi:hypothetical protein